MNFLIIVSNEKDSSQVAAIIKTLYENGLEAVLLSPDELESLLDKDSLNSTNKA